MKMETTEFDKLFEETMAMATTANETKHTATPWKANGLKNDSDPAWRLACAVWANDGETPICSTRFSVGRYHEVDAETQDANAAFIVEAVNSHDKLVRDNAALLEALKKLNNLFIWHRGEEGTSRKMESILNTAIAQAEKESD